MNVPPMMRRFCSGSSTPRAGQEQRAASTSWMRKWKASCRYCMTRWLRRAAARRCHEDARQLVTMARWIRAATTVESTRRSARNHAGIADTCTVAPFRVDKAFIVQSARARQMRKRKLARTRRRAACGPPPDGTGRRTGGASGRRRRRSPSWRCAQHRPPGRQRVHLSRGSSRPGRHHRQNPQQVGPIVDNEVGGPYSRRGRGPPGRRRRA